MRKLGELVPAVLLLVGAVVVPGCGSSPGKRVDGAPDLADAGTHGDAPAEMGAAVDFGMATADATPTLDLSSDEANLIVKPIEEIYACGELLSDSAKLLDLWRDPWTGLPYDNIPCGGPFAANSASANPAWGVVPQLAFADISMFSQDATRTEATVYWSFADRAPDNTIPSQIGRAHV